MGITGKRNRKNRLRKLKKRFSLNRPDTEDLMVNAQEHEILKKFSEDLQKRFNVKIIMPKAKSLDSDVIFVSIKGESTSRDSVKVSFMLQM